MKVLVVSAGDHTTLGWSYARAFQALGHSVSVHDPMVRLRKSPLWANRVSRRFCEKAIIRRFDGFLLRDMLEQNDVDTVFVGKGAWSLPQLWKRYKAERPSTKLICYNADDPITTWSRGGNRPWVTEAIQHYDLYVTYNRALIEPIRAALAKEVLRLPFAWDPDVHPMQRFTDAADVVFVGNADTYREKWLTELVEHPDARDWRVEIHGHWPKVSSPILRRAVKPVQKTGLQMAKLVASARISLNILRQQNEGSHNMRTFETPGCGGVLASQFSSEQDEVFPEGKAAIYFRTPKEAVQVINRYVENPQELAELRAESRKRVQKECYLERAKVLVSAIEKLPR